MVRCEADLFTRGKLYTKTFALSMGFLKRAHVRSNVLRVLLIKLGHVQPSSQLRVVPQESFCAPETTPDAPKDSSE